MILFICILTLLLNTLIGCGIVIFQQLRVLKVRREDKYALGYMALNATAAACGVYLSI